MNGCAFIDSTGMATLAAAAVRLNAEGRVLRVRGVSEQIRRIFELAGLVDHDSIELESKADDGP